MARHALRRFVFGARLRRSGYAALAVIALARCATGPGAQTQPALATTDKPGTRMNQFCFSLFDRVLRSPRPDGVRRNRCVSEH